MGLAKKIEDLKHKVQEIENSHNRANQSLADTAQRLIKVEQELAEVKNRKFCKFKWTDLF